MDIQKLQDILDKLAPSFNFNKLTVIVDNHKYTINDIIIDKDELTFAVEDVPTVMMPIFEDTILDDNIDKLFALTGYPDELLLRTVKSIKDTLKCGLKEAKDLFDALRHENVPIILGKNLSEGEKTCIMDKFPEGCTFDTL